MRNLSMEGALKTKLVGYDLTVKQYLMKTLLDRITSNDGSMTPFYDTFGRGEDTNKLIQAAIRYLCL